MEDEERYRILAQQANDLLGRLADAGLHLYRNAPTMPYADYQQRQAKITRLCNRAFRRLCRRLNVFSVE